MLKKLFFEKVKVLGKEYANNIVMDAGEHQDAVQAILDDYMAGAEEAYNTLRNYKKEEFCKALREIQKYQENLSKLEELLGCDLFESSICESASYLIQHLVEALASYDSETIDDINWWLYEDVEKEWIIDGDTISVETPEQLYDALKNLNRV